MDQTPLVRPPEPTRPTTRSLLVLWGYALLVPVALWTVTHPAMAAVLVGGLLGATAIVRVVAPWPHRVNATRTAATTPARRTVDTDPRSWPQKPNTGTNRNVR